MSGKDEKTEPSPVKMPAADDQEEDSFAKKTPIKREAKRSAEIRSKAPVGRERDDYKTFKDIKLPMSDADFDK